MKLDPVVTQIIVASNFDNFTTSDVRSAYLVLKNDPLLDPIVIRKKLYAELLKLVNKGWLNKKSSNIKGQTRFSKTTLFDVNILTQNTNKSSYKARNSNSNVPSNQTLTGKLNHYRSELLLNLGETEAYKEIYAEFPNLANSIQQQYNEARDNNTKILGKIRAIEGLMNQENKDK